MPPEPNNIVNIYCAFSPRPLAPGRPVLRVRSVRPPGRSLWRTYHCGCALLRNNNGSIYLGPYTAFIIHSLPASSKALVPVTSQSPSILTSSTSYSEDRSPTTQLSATTSVSIGFNLSASSPACVAKPPIQPRFSPQSTVTHLVPAESSLSTAVRVTTCQLSLRWVDHLVQSCQIPGGQLRRDSHQAHGSL